MSNEMHRTLHMKGGNGEYSYATNSTLQVTTLSKESSVLVRSVLNFCDTYLSEEFKVMNIAELGCSSGPSALIPVTDIINSICKSCPKSIVPQFFLFLNDLPGNDFNTLFKYIPAFQEKLRRENGPDSPLCFVTAVPGSFHGRLFPSNTLHFLHSSFSLHWLSQVPPELSNKSVVNKGKIYISKTSPGAVIEAYQAQFKRDFSSFLKARSEEVTRGGRMVLLFSGRAKADPSPDGSCLLWDYLGQAFQHLVNQGVIEEESVDSYDTPYYEPYIEEVKDEIEKEGSFGIAHLGISTVTWKDINGGVNCDRATTAKNVAKAIRAGNESMFQSHFGAQIMDALFERFCKIMEADTKVVDHFIIVLSLSRKS